MTRKIIQIATAYTENSIYPSRILALCNDGTLWRLTNDGEKWIKLPNIPQDEIDYKAIAEKGDFKKPDSVLAERIDLI